MSSRIYDAQLWARVGALNLEELDVAARFAVETAAPLSEGLVASLNWALLLLELPPRVIHYPSGGEVWAVCADACYEQSSGLTGLGAVLYRRGENQLVEYWAALAPRELLDVLEGRQAAADYTVRALCMGGCCGNSLLAPRSRDSHLQMAMQSFYAWLPSGSNLADGISRGTVGQLVAKGAKPVRPVVPSVCKGTRLHFRPTSLLLGCGVPLAGRFSRFGGGAHGAPPREHRPFA
eukprot:2807505-Amphidinium_carterae.7